MVEPGLNAGISPLDEAHAKWLAGDRDGALRQAIAVLDADAYALGAASLIAQALVAAKRPLVAGEAVVGIVDGFVRRGDFPAAAVAAAIMEAAGEDAKLCRKTIAAAFGKGSKRIGDVSGAPPPLPAAAHVTPALAKLSGTALLERAEQALEKLMSAKDPAPADAKLPELPLVSALEPAQLEQLLAHVSIREIPTGEPAVLEGEEGQEAFIVVRGVLRVRRGGGETGRPETTLAALGPGAIFGEMALVSDAPRAASVLAVEPSQLIVLARAELEKLARKSPAIGKELGAFCQARMVSNLIRHSDILGSVEPQYRADLISRFVTRTFDTGESLVKQGEESEGLFLIASGSVEVQSRDADGDPLVLARLGPGDVVGEISLVLRRPATADVLAAHPTVALELRREEFHQVIREHPTLLGELYELATKREEQTRTVVAQEALDLDDVVLV